MLLKRLIAAIGVAGSLGAAAPAFADWVQVPVPMPPSVVVEAPAMPVYADAYYGRPGVYYRDGYNPGYWRWRRHHEWRERMHGWRERRFHHRWHDDD